MELVTLFIDRPTNNVTSSIYKFVLASSGFEIGPAPFADQHQTQNNYNFVDTVSWVKGKHVLRFGGEYTRVHLDKLFPQVFNGELFFTNTTNGNTDFQNFLLGSPQFSFGGGGVYNHEYRTNNYGFFAQDDWKIRRDLTLNLGLRAEVFGAFYDNACHIGNLDPGLANSGQFPFVYPSCVKNLSLAGLTGSATRTTLDNNYSTGLGPRIGLAYDVFGRHTTTIRGGYRSEEHTSELQSRLHLVCRLLLEKKKILQIASLIRFHNKRQYTLLILALTHSICYAELKSHL